MFLLFYKPYDLWYVLQTIFNYCCVLSLARPLYALKFVGYKVIYMSVFVAKNDLFLFPPNSLTPLAMFNVRAAVFSWICVKHVPNAVML